MLNWFLGLPWIALLIWSGILILVIRTISDAMSDQITHKSHIDNYIWVGLIGAVVLYFGLNIVGGFIATYQRASAFETLCTTQRIDCSSAEFKEWQEPHRRFFVITVPPLIQLSDEDTTPATAGTQEGN